MNKRDMLSSCRFLIRSVVLLCAFLAVGRASANHVLAADIEYTCLGGTSYEITLNLYRDCSGAPLIPVDLQFDSDCGTSFMVQNLPVSAGTEVSQICAASLPNSTCSGGSLPGTELYQFTTIVNLANCDGWRISWADCCRSITANAVGTFGTYVEAVLNSATAPCNNSPMFNDGFIPYVCVNQPITYNFGVLESDGDSLVYSLVDAQWSAPIPTPIFYQAGFSGAVPFPVVTLDPVTGQLNFTAPTIGNYVVAVLVEEYNAAGDLVGSVTRDMMVIVLACTGNVPNSAAISNNTAGTITGANSIQTCDGEVFCVDVTFTDPDPADVLAVTAAAATMPAGATLTVAGTNPATATFCWTADINESPVNVILTANDGSCPIENLALAAINVAIFNNGVSPDPGVDNSILLCESDGPVDLYTQLGGTPDPGGTWTFPNGSPHGGTLDPATDPDGAYTYTVPGVCGAADASAVVSVSINMVPNAGIGATLNLCNVGGPVNLITGLFGAPTPGGTWTDPNGLPHSGTLDPQNDPAGIYTYNLVGIPPCSDASSMVTVNISGGLDAGLDATINVCAGGPVVNLFNALGGTPDPGGAWIGPTGAPTTVNFTPGVQTPGSYTYTIPGAPPCGSASAVVTVNVVAGADPGMDSQLMFCGFGTVTNLNGALGGTPDPGGMWTDPFNAAHSGIFNPTFNAPGIYTYTILGAGGCPDVSATVTVSYIATPNAGVSGTAMACALAFPFPLLDSLGGAPDPGGMWTDPAGNPFGGNFNAGTNAPGIYTYTVSGTAPCVDVSSTVTVSIGTPLNAGTSGSQTFCSIDPAVDLFTVLTAADPGGVWTDPNGNPFVQPFDPMVDIPGTYVYSFPAVSGCAGSSASVIATLGATVDAGMDGSLTLCAAGLPVDLFSALQGTPDVGGVWTDPSGNPFTQPFDPTVDLGGNYTYSVGGGAACGNAQAVVTVNLAPVPNSGTNTFWDLCETYPTLNLLTLLGGAPDPGGIWTDPNNVVVAGGVLDPATGISGTYTYTVAGVAPCTDAQSLVNVVINQQAEPGNDTTLTLCNSGPVTDLFLNLGGIPLPGGVWNDFNGDPFSGLFDPTSDPDGIYYYVLQGPGSCPEDSAGITVNTVLPSSAGFSNSLTVCSSDPIIDLFTVLGGAPSLGGGWMDPAGAPFSGNMDPAVDQAGVYTYTVPGNGPCPDAMASVTVNVSNAVDAGTDATIDLCSDGIPVDLFTQLGGAPSIGGIWTGPSGATSASFDPAVDVPGVYTYTLAGVFPCSSSSAQVTVNVNTMPNAGLDASVSICDLSPTVPLLNLLGGAPSFGGIWIDPNGVSHNGLFTPGVDPTGVYVYTVSGAAPCLSASSMLTVNITSSPTAGGDGVITLCAAGASINLIDQLTGTPDPSGSWTDPNGLAIAGAFDPSVDPPGVYTYTVTATAPCVSDAATVTISVVPVASAGLDASITICNTSTSLNLFGQLGGTPDVGGLWSGPNGVSNGTFDPAVDPAGNYTYTITSAAPCSDQSAVVMVNLVNAPFAGTPGASTACSTGGNVTLFNQLGGAPDPSGIWTDPNGLGHSGVFDPMADPVGNYTYTVSGTAPCASTSQIVMMNVTPAPNAGMNGTSSVCLTGGPVNLFLLISGTPDAGGTWIGPNGVFGGTLDPLLDPPGNYTYTVSGVAPCADASTILTVSITPMPNAGTAGSVDVCSSGGVVDLFLELGGTPDLGGTWIDPNGNAHGGILDPAVDPAGIYVYMIAGTGSCAGASQMVSVNIFAPVNAGLDAMISVCATGGGTNLFGQLGGLPNPGGSWIGPNGAFSGVFDPLVDSPGNYTYTVTGTMPCPNASAVVTVNIIATPNAGNAGSVNVCVSGGSVGLFGQLGGGPDPGGIWNNPNGQLHSGQFNPAVDSAGIYTYTLPGVGGCMGASQAVTVSIAPLVNAGSNGTNSVCTGDPVFDLFPQLSGTPGVGGTWLDPLGNATTGSVDPAVDPAGVYLYILNGGACPDDTALVDVLIFGGPNAGFSNAITICSNVPPFNLLDSLTGTPDPGGAWTNAGGAPIGATFDPSTGISGIFDYTVLGNASCPDDTSTLIVTVSIAPEAGSNGMITLCANDLPTALFGTLGGTPDVGGVWTGPGGGVTTGIVDPAVGPAGNYTYTVSGTAPCAAASATVNVVIVPIAYAGEDSSLVVCSADAPFDLIAGLGGSPVLTGSWVDGSGNSVSALFNPAVDPAGTYLYIVSQGNGCGADTAMTTVQVIQAPVVGTNGTAVLCANDAPFAIVDSLQGNPDPGGTWFNSNGLQVSSVFDPAVDPSGAYQYVVQGNTPCIADTATVAVNVLTTPDPQIGFTESLGCAPKEVVFTNLGSTSGTCFWNFGNGDTSNTCGGDTIVYADAGSYLANLTVSLPNGCSAFVTSVTPVDVFDQPIAGVNAVPPVVSQSDPVVFFQNTASGFNDHFWDFGDLGIVQEFSPAFTFPSVLPDEYEVCQYVFADASCFDSICVTIEVVESTTILVPNAFTPNGDGVNDAFLPVVLGIRPESYEFLIFNRWGDALFSTQQLGEAWDGSSNGTESQQDVYVWQVLAQDALTGEKVRKVGHVTLVR